MEWAKQPAVCKLNINLSMKLLSELSGNPLVLLNEAPYFYLFLYE